MAFGMSGLGGHKNTASTGGAGNTASVSDTGSQGRQVRELQALKPGQTINGEVIAKHGSEVQIRIDADSIMNARLEKDINLTLGQPMTFEVKSNTTQQLALRPLFENTGQDANGMRALQQAALPVNQKTLSMVKALMEQGMGIDKNTLQNVYKDIMTNTGSLPADVVALHKLQVPVTQESLNQLDGYRNFEHQLVKGIETIAESIKDTLLELVSVKGGGDVQEAAGILRDIIQIIAGKAAADTQTLPSGGFLPNDGILQNSGILPNDGILQSSVILQNSSMEEEKQALQSTGQNTLETEVTQAREITEGHAAGTDKAGRGNPDGSGTDSVLTAAGKEPAGETKAAEFLAGRDGEPLLTAEERTTFADQLKAFGVQQEVAEQVRTGRIGAAQLLEHIAGELTKHSASRETITALLTGKGMQQLLKGQIENNWLLTPQQTASKEEIDKLYGRLREQTEKLSQVMEETGKGNTGLAKNVQNLKENVDFMQQLNQNFTYLQLPIKRFGKNAHGDLYVYTNKKNLVKKEGSVSALLHLDMEYLGSMDIYVSMQKERVSTKFYLQKEEMLDFLEGKMDILNERLLQRGYTMNTQVVYKEEQANVAAQMMKQEGETSMLSMFSFDVRA